jgi:methionine sulfoxide reductase heme-binding subunit
MDKPKRTIWISSVVALLVYILFAASVRDSSLIWIQARVFGLLSFFSLFIAVVLGEMRLLSKVKAKFGLFRFHTPMAIFAMFMVVAHFASAALDNFKWGKGVAFVQYLGFSFSDKWLVYLSLGTLAFYLMLIIGLTSRTTAIQRIGFKRWKLIHFLSYLSFVVAYIHSVNLGTDLKTSFLAPYLSVTVILMFFFVISLLITRFIGSFGAFADQWEINLAATFLIVLFVGSVLITRSTLQKDQQLADLESQLASVQADIAAQERSVHDLSVRARGLADGVSALMANTTVDRSQSVVGTVDAIGSVP